MSTYCVGIDIGGTFTDAAFVDEQSGTVQIIEVPGTPPDPSAERWGDERAVGQA